MERSHRIAAIVVERGLSTTGFRRALKALANEVSEDEGDDAQYLLREWIGEYKPVPAAFKIRRDDARDSIYGVTVEVYEVEGTAELPEWKLAYYGDCADSDGPQFELHILDRYDHEIVVRSEDLMRFMSLPYWTEAHKREELKWLRSQAVAQHHAPVTVELGIDVLQDVIYQLGTGQSHNAVAKRTGLSSERIKTVADLMAANSVNPKDIVKDTHARWKAAYDALRELGVKL